MRRLFLFAILAVAGYQSIAQKKVDYYSNGAKKFEGDYFYAWKTDEPGDLTGPLDTTELYYSSESELSALDLYMNMFPSKEYEGICTFYFRTGEKAFQGNYSRGVKNGKFSYWWTDGTLVAEKSFVNGMADGKWLTYGLAKQPLVTESYKAFTQAQLDTLYGDITKSFRRDGSSEDERLDNDWWNMGSRRKIDYSDAELAGVDRFVSQMDEFVKELQQRSIWDGEFIYLNAETKNKAIEMYFKDNVPVGTWKVWDGNEKLEMEGSFKDGKLVKFKDHIRPQQPPVPSAEPVRDAKGKEEQALVEPPPPTEVFKYVEQMPEAPYDVNEYISQNLQLPTDTVIAGRVNVQFVVQGDGTITDVERVGSKRWPASYEEAAVNVVKSMPQWKPGKQNGRPVKVYFTLPVVFKAK
ncbi:MAG: TonB family protein [Flavipsychrobacter sp.]|jgi:TonB family protein|nr:TonB family protein [Flavipsychrobacter sp.]